MVIEGDFTAPLGEPEISRFQPGGSLAVGAYRSLHPVFAVGGRLRGSLFGDGPAPVDRMIEDEGVGGLYTFSLAARLRPFGSADDYARFTGVYLDVSAGAAVTENLLRPVFEAGIGYNFEAGDVGIGPVLRYQWVPHEGPIQDQDGHFVLLGIEVALFDGRGTYEPVASVRAPYELCPDQDEDLDGFQDDDGCPDPDNDRDGILDVDDGCPNLMETLNGYNDDDGCPDSATLELVNDRIVIHDDIFFSFDEAVIRPSGHRVLDQLVALWGSHPEWTGMMVEGHADNRGTIAYNDDLSEQRALAVEAALVAHGLDQARVHIRAVGERRPLVPNAQTEAEHSCCCRTSSTEIEA